MDNLIKTIRTRIDFTKELRIPFSTEVGWYSCIASLCCWGFCGIALKVSSPTDSLFVVSPHFVLISITTALAGLIALFCGRKHPGFPQFGNHYERRPYLQALAFCSFSVMGPFLIEQICFFFPPSAFLLRCEYSRTPRADTDAQIVKLLNERTKQCARHRRNQTQGRGGDLRAAPRTGGVASHLRDESGSYYQ